MVIVKSVSSIRPMVQKKIKVLGKAGLSEATFSESAEATDYFYKVTSLKTVSATITLTISASCILHKM